MLSPGRESRRDCKALSPSAPPRTGTPFDQVTFRRNQLAEIQQHGGRHAWQHGELAGESMVNVALKVWVRSLALVAISWLERKLLAAMAFEFGVGTRDIAFPSDPMERSTSPILRTMRTTDSGTSMMTSIVWYSAARTPFAWPPPPLEIFHLALRNPTGKRGFQHGVPQVLLGLREGGGGGAKLASMRS
ncbi:MAG: hypothetical protein IPG64_11615 [Haliea sp.]|nr:hypothetical protein [Haliea sp.]